MFETNNHQTPRWIGRAGIVLLCAFVTACSEPSTNAGGSESVIAQTPEVDIETPANETLIADDNETRVTLFKGGMFAEGLQVDFVDQDDFRSQLEDGRIVLSNIGFDNDQTPGNVALAQSNVRIILPNTVERKLAGKLIALRVRAASTYGDADIALGYSTMGNGQSRYRTKPVGSQPTPAGIQYRVPTSVDMSEDTIDAVSLSNFSTGTTIRVSEIWIDILND